jgi:iron complex transport system substrate-binding protein
MTGRKVTIPASVDKVACLVGPSYDAVFMLGGTNKISMLGSAQGKWAQVLNPAVKQIPASKNAQNPNIEELMSNGAQVVFFWDYPDPTKAMTEAGIPVVCSLASQSNPTTAEECMNSIKADVQLYASVLGPAYQAKADAYNKYLDDCIKRITAVTSAIPASQRPGVYYVRGPGALTVHGEFSNTRWWVEMAGGNFVTKAVPTNTYTDVTMEQVINWNPDVIFMGRVNNTALIVNDPKWSGINAVKNNKVYVNPYGNFYYDSGVEGPLLMMYVAKTLYPDKFASLDMVKELKNFYTQFFGYSLTDDQANRILNYQDP